MEEKDVYVVWIFCLGIFVAVGDVLVLAIFDLL